jgi:hypothetical protein
MAAGALEKGYEASAPTKLIIPFDVARKMMVDGDNAAAMQGAGAPSEAGKKLAEQIREMTD